MFRRKESRALSHPPTPKRRFTDAFATMDTVIGPNVHLHGDLKGKANLEIHGRLDGTTDIEGLVVLRQDGRLKGQIKATSAVVEGTLEGSIEVSDKVELGATSKVTGDIRAGAVAIAEGSFFQGKVQMDGSAQAARPAGASRAARPSSPTAGGAKVGFDEKRGGKEG